MATIKFNDDWTELYDRRRSVSTKQIPPIVPETELIVPVVPEESGLGNTKTKPQQKQISPAIHWCFTLNNPTENEEMLFRVCPKIKKYVYQLEEGENKTPHLQGYIEFFKKDRPLSVIPCERIHWEKTKDVPAAILYCQKPDGRLKPTQFKGIFPSRPKCPINETNLRPWQKALEEKIILPPDDRKIMWYWEDIGNFGKTVFTKYLALKYNALVVSGKAADMKYAVIKYIEEHGDPYLIIIDVPRGGKEYVSYTGIEEIKNGIFFSGKYESGQAIFASPHVLIFANEEPIKEKLSADRWDIVALRAESSA